MLEREVRERLQEIVNEKIASGEPFTAYDITQRLRAESYWVRHEDARAEVHRLYLDGEMPGFDRCLVPKGGPVPAWEYYPAITGHPALAGSSGCFLSPGLLAPSSARSYRRARTRSALPAPGGGLMVPLDGRATVCIPASFVRQAALQPGDRVQVFIDGQNTQLVVRPSGAGSDPLGLPARRYTVDRHCNIRITRTTQLRAGLHGLRRLILAHRDELIVAAA